MKARKSKWALALVGKSSDRSVGDSLEEVLARRQTLVLSMARAKGITIALFSVWQPC
jgi:hypothetical protein